MDTGRVGRNPTPGIPGLPSRTAPGGPQPASPPAGTAASFDQILSRVSDEVALSHHAQQRLSARRIALAEGQWRRLARAVDLAAAKGARDSLVLLDQMAFVVSVKNRTVITAMDGRYLTDNVFTNIDSAVIAKD